MGISEESCSCDALDSNGDLVARISESDVLLREMPDIHERVHQSHYRICKACIASGGNTHIPPSTKIILDLLELCAKKELKGTIKRKGMVTIIGVMRPRLVTAYNDGFSDSECNRGGSGVFLKYPDNTASKRKVSSRQVASNFPCELIAIRTALDIYLTRTNITNSDGIIMLSDCRSALEAIKEGEMGLTQEINSLLFSIGALRKSCTLQWIPAHVDIEGNKMVDSLESESKTLEHVTSSTTFIDAYAVANQKFCSNPRKNFRC
ncbi:RNase H domain-containing protein [Trichonephila clavipes]|nr:RNase H domain-containing protein [Trichonephila clavipes]